MRTSNTEQAKRLQWLGHVHRMDNNRIPSQALTLLLEKWKEKAWKTQRRWTWTDCRWLRTLLPELFVVPSVRLIYAAVFTSCRYDKELTIQDCHDYIQSQTNQHTSLHDIIDQWLHPIMNFMIIWQVTVFSICCYSYIFSEGFCFWLTYHLEQTSVLL